MTLHCLVQLKRWFLHSSIDKDEERLAGSPSLCLRCATPIR